MVGQGQHGFDRVLIRAENDMLLIERPQLLATEASLQQQLQQQIAGSGVINRAGWPVSRSTTRGPAGRLA